ncbi:MAG TPA: MlaD family protein [Chthoniobacteraceae bacterium]|nr:MlaD family protein [Chthoniobacteraceae bacterium]
MNIQRNEIRTGLLVVLSLGILVTVLIYLGAPGVFVKQKTFRIYFDNASGLKPGAQVMLAGRKIGQVRRLFSPVPEQERPTPKMEALVEVIVAADSPIYKTVKAQMTQNGLLGETLIDFTTGQEASGLAPDGHSFLGERPGGIADAVPAVLEKIDPVLIKATTTLESLQSTSENLSKITAEGADLPAAFAEFKKFGANLNELSGEQSSLRRSLNNIEAMTGKEGKLDETLENVKALTGPDGSLQKTLKNAERFTADLASNKDIPGTLRNFRAASEKLSGTVDQLGNQFSAVGANLTQASDTVKRQPWRLIWPSTKKYDEEGRFQPPQPRLKVEAKSRAKTTPAPRRNRRN